MLVTPLAPVNATMSTTSSASSLSPSLEFDRCVDVWQCVSWLISKLCVEYGELISTLESI
jgi:hypothetical protein